MSMEPTSGQCDLSSLTPQDLNNLLAAAREGDMIEIPSGKHDFSGWTLSPDPLTKAVTIRSCGRTA